MSYLRKRNPLEAGLKNQPLKSKRQLKAAMAAKSPSEEGEEMDIIESDSESNVEDDEDDVDDQGAGERQNKCGVTIVTASLSRRRFVRGAR